MTKKILLLVFVAVLCGVSGNGQTKKPKTVRDFFYLLPYKYFEVEGCRSGNNSDCKSGRDHYLQTFLRVDDAANGYLEGGCEGGQACIEMALFKRPNGTYFVGVATFTTMTDDYYFLEYKNGKWYDISYRVIPGFSKSHGYRLPRYGTTIEVFSNKIIEKGSDYEITEPGPKVYDLIWNEGEFTIQK
jgi:hypothetical protein